MDAKTDSDDVIILPPDTRLKNKLEGLSLTELLSDEVLREAQGVIAEASSDFYLECFRESERLTDFVRTLKKNGKGSVKDREELIAITFSIKTKAGVSGYDLVAALGKSLEARLTRLRCEALTEGAELRLLDWYAQSIAKLLAFKVKGDGGVVGQAILVETERLSLSA